MKRLFPLSIFILVLSVITGFLFSKMSFVGRLGVRLFYKEYSFLKTWWKGALVVFAILFTLMLLQNIIQQKFEKRKAIFYHSIAVIVALIGMYFTYRDFQDYYMHRWLKEKFHLGGYLFWLGWISISLFFIYEKQTKKMQSKNSDMHTTV